MDSLEGDRIWLEYRRKDIRKEKDASKRLRSFSHHGDLEEVLRLLPEGVYAFCAGAHPRLGAFSPVRLLPRPLLKVIVRFAHAPIDINAADKQRGLCPGGTALHYACEHGHVEVAGALIRNGADINARRYPGETVLMAACAARRGTYGVQRPDLDTARLILKSGADVNLGSRCLGTALLRAADCNHVDVVRLLLEFGAEVDRRDGSGRTPLIAACRGGRRGTTRSCESSWTRAPTSMRARRMANARCTTRVTRATHRRRSSYSTVAPTSPRELAETPSAPFSGQFETVTKTSDTSARPYSRRCGPAPRASRPRTRISRRGSRATRLTMCKGGILPRDEPSPTSPASQPAPAIFRRP